MVTSKPTNQYILSTPRFPWNHQGWLPKEAYYGLYGNWTCIMRLTVTIASTLYPKISTCFKTIMVPCQANNETRHNYKSLKPKGKQECQKSGHHDKLEESIYTALSLYPKQKV